MPSCDNHEFYLMFILLIVSLTVLKLTYFLYLEAIVKAHIVSIHVKHKHFIIKLEHVSVSMSVLYCRPPSVTSQRV